MNLSKPCKTCGREFEWRKKWENNWDEVQYCSKQCSSRKPNKVDKQIESTILGLLADRSTDTTICPSEAARIVFGEDAFNQHMERTRQAARRLVHQGKISILQKGKRIDPTQFKGPIRLKKS